MTVDLAADGAIAAAMISAGSYDVVVIADDPPHSATQLCAEVRRRSPGSHVLILGAERAKVSAESDGVVHLSLPLDQGALLAQLREMEEM